MFERILNRMRDKVRTRQYIMTLHAEEEMDDDRLSIYDIEHVILTGKIIERQKDPITAEWKYLIQGNIFSEGNVTVAAKLSPTGKLVILTVYTE